ncbi:MAG TPA: SRPBCC family protein [Candidatus Limnocylindrales bacterium]|nr:SRPBCC family protein [Candidatus Limnocylindrales bacterium]
MSHLSTVLVVDAPAVTVFDIVADPTRNPEWQTLLADMGEIAGRPGGVGSSYVGYYRVAGRRLAGRFIVTAAERPTLHQVDGTTTGGWARWTTLIQPRGARCELRVSLEYELPGEIVGSIFGMLTGSRIEQEFRRTYDRLKKLAEAVARTEPTPFDRGDEDQWSEDAGKDPEHRATGGSGRVVAG